MTYPFLFLFAFLVTLVPPAHAAAKELSPPDSTTRTIVVENYYYASPGKADEVYRWRLHASDVRAALGLRRGRVLRILADQEQGGTLSELPDVIWECDYPSTEARAADIRTLGASLEWKGVETHMDSLIRKFQRMVFEATAAAVSP